MKKIYITLILAIMLIFPQVVLAAGGVSISAPSSVESGNNVTIKVTISNVAAWNIKITASGATDGVTKSYADATEDALNTTKTFSITCNSKGTGSINIKVSGDVTTQDGKNTDISSSKTISVTAKTTPVPTPTPAPTPKPTPSNPSSKPNTENGGTTQNQQPQSKPNQNTNTNSPQTQTSKQNEDKKIDKTNSTTENQVTENKQEEKEEEQEKTEQTQEERKSIKIKINEKEYTVIENREELPKLNSYEDTSIKINEIDIPALESPITKLTIIGIKDENGKTMTAVYNNNTYKIYNETTSKLLTLFITDGELNNYNKTTIIIDDQEYNAYEIDDRFAVVYAMNLNDGEYNYYKYDKKDGTFQYYETKDITNNNKSYKIIISALSILLIIAIITIFILFFRKKQ
ncbi:MAG: hypothetical protein ACLUHC_01375 [Clostridia bacterium]